MTLRGNSSLGKALFVIYNMIRRGHDGFLVITGDEGTGKSVSLLLNMIDFWYKRCVGSPVNKKCFVMNLNDLPDLLNSDKQKFAFKGLDEAGDELDLSQSSNKYNQALYTTYTVIRGEGYLTVIVLPSIFDLNYRFRNRRVRLLIHAKARHDNECKACKNRFVGLVCDKCQSADFKPGWVDYAIYSRTRLRKIFYLNRDRPGKSLSVVKPTGTGRIGEYTGSLRKQYDKMKLENQSRALEELKELFDVKKGKRICKHSDIQHSVKKNVWRCRKCGKVWKKSPFESKKEEGSNLDI